MSDTYAGHKKPGRKPITHDLANYCCPKCNQQPVQKSPHKNMCTDCYRAYTRDKSRVWHRKNRGKGYNKPGRPPEITGTGYCVQLSAKYLSMSLHPMQIEPK